MSMTVLLYFKSQVNISMDSLVLGNGGDGAPDSNRKRFVTIQNLHIILTIYLLILTEIVQQLRNNRERISMFISKMIVKH